MRTLLSFWLAAMWFVHQNNYFGWNSKPQSDAELIADGIFYLALLMAILASKVKS